MNESGSVKPLQSPRSAPLLISFSGMDGSGKSTQIEMLCNRLLETGISVKQLAFWDNVVAFAKHRAGFSHKFLKSEGGIGAPGNPVERNDKNNRAWYLTLGRYGLYVLDALNLGKVVAQARRSGASVIIFDRYIYDQLATLPLELPLARAYARMVLRLVPRPDVAYLLDAEPAVARERKPEYPLGFLHEYRRSYHRLRDMAGLSMISPMGVEEAHTAIMQRLARCAGLADTASHRSLEVPVKPLV